MGLTPEGGSAGSPFCSFCSAFLLWVSLTREPAAAVGGEWVGMRGRPRLVCDVGEPNPLSGLIVRRYYWPSFQMSLLAHLFRKRRILYSGVGANMEKTRPRGGIHNSLIIWKVSPRGVGSHRRHKVDPISFLHLARPETENRLGPTTLSPKTSVLICKILIGGNHLLSMCK